MATFNAAVFIQNLGTASVIVQDFAIITGLISKKVTSFPVGGCMKDTEELTHNI